MSQELCAAQQYSFWQISVQSIRVFFTRHSNKASQSCSSLPPLAGLAVVSDRHREPFYFLTTADDHVAISTGAQYYTFRTVHSASQALHAPEDINPIILRKKQTRNVKCNLNLVMSVH